MFTIIWSTVQVHSWKLIKGKNQDENLTVVLFNTLYTS